MFVLSSAWHRGWGAPRSALLTVFLTGAVVAGCSRSMPEPPPPSRPPAVSPRQTILRVMELRRERKYTELRELVVPESGPEVMTTLMAVDEFLDANRRLCTWVRDNVGIGLSQTIDQSYIGDMLGIFARYVELLDESITGGQADISFTVDGRLPARRALLRKVDGVWRYDPESGYPEQLPAAFREMARGLDQVLSELENGRITVAELRDDASRLMERVQHNLRRGVRLLSEARAAAENRSRK